jgi:hypothetical protein
MPEPITYVMCAASGMAVPIRKEDPPDKTLAPASIVALGYLRDNPDIEWAKAARIRIPPEEQYVWLLITEENEEKLDGDVFDFNHGAVFATEQAKARKADNVIEVQGEIDEQLYVGSAETRVDREALQDEDVQKMLDALEQQSNPTISTTDERDEEALREGTRSEH